MTDRPPREQRSIAVLFASSVFLGAFLLFQVQPVIGKFILPWFGSSPAVWTTCMLFFQVLLLGGYAYAHLLVRLGRPAVQAAVHCALLASSVLLLPITPAADGLPETGDDPTLRILAVLATSVGAPYLVLSATGPLLLGWMARLAPDRPAYRLYALSNAGSLLALLSYPFLFEPALRLEQQTAGWSVAFGVFALACAACAVVSGRVGVARAEREATVDSPSADGPQPSVFDLALWVALAACGSALLLATTNQLCLDVAVVPFLWVLPLSLYLLTFILCFDHPRWYHRGIFAALLPMAAAVAVYLLYAGVNLGITLQICGYSMVLFVGCMCCHGELVRAKPGARHLTLFFLTVSLGGAIGGICVALVAPAVFTEFLEFHVAVAAAVVLMVVATWHAGAIDRKGVVWASIGVTGLVGLLAWQGIDVDEDVQAKERNFYGVLTVERYFGEGDSILRTTLAHGRINHGNQNGRQPDWPTTYYGPLSGIGLAVRLHPARGERGLRVGVVGLGTGTLAAYANSKIQPYVEEGPKTEGAETDVAETDVAEADGAEVGSLTRRVEPRSGGHSDYMRFYEINPLVIDWAWKWFSYLSDARGRGADVDVVRGDARLAMQQQLDRDEPQRFDVLAIDAFTGDAIPIHLLTAECLATYWNHLAADGILAVHVSNRFIDLIPVVRRHAGALGKQIVVVEDPSHDELDSGSSTWVLMTDNGDFLKLPELPETPAPTDTQGPLWTDDYSSVAPLLK